MEDSSSERPAGGGRDPRLVVALGGIVVLAAIVVAVVLSGGSSDEKASAAAPAKCIEDWNADPEALAFGQHNYGSHGYERVQVTRLTEEAEELSEGEEGVCAVIFGALQLDTEPIAAGQLLVDEVWAPISLQPGVELTRVAELQAIAEGQPNSSLTGDGLLAAYAER